MHGCIYPVARMQRMTLGAAIKKRELTFGKLARLVKARTGRTMNKSTISRLVRQKTKPQHETVEALEVALALKPGQLTFKAA